MSSRYENVRCALREDLPPWGVLVFESHHASEFTMPWRTHPFVKIVYVLDGAGAFDIHEEVLDFSAGDVVVIPPGTPNRIRDREGRPVSLYAACVANSVLDCVPNLRARLRVQKWSQQTRQSLAVASVLRRMVWIQDRSSDSKPIEMMTDAWRLMGLVFEESNHPATKKGIDHSDRESPDREIVRQYVDSLPTRFLDAQSIDEAAESCGLSRRTFTRLFREETGTSWLAHVRQLAIDHASELLRKSDLPIVSVAFEAGFSDLSTFYRQFAKRVGRSPAVFRDSFRKT